MNIPIIFSEYEYVIWHAPSFRNQRIFINFLDISESKFLLNDFKNFIKIVLAFNKTYLCNYSFKKAEDKNN